MNFKKLFFLLVTLVSVSCGEDVTPVEQSIESKVLFLGNGTEPKDLDPHTVTGVPESKILMALLEGLVIRNPDGTEPIPGVAKSWTISKDGKEYIFSLRDAFWSNGDPVTAFDFVYSWKRMLMPSLGSKYPDMLYDVEKCTLDLVLSSLTHTNAVWTAELASKGRQFFLLHPLQL